MSEQTIPTLNYWAIEYFTNRHQPKDIDFWMSENCYFDIEVYGEIWDSWCNPEIVSFNHFFSTNDGQPLTFTIFRNPFWIASKPTWGIYPDGFVAKSFRVIVYSDSIRTNVINTITGNINIYDPYLIDTVHWFPSLITQFTENQSIGVNQSLDIYCLILQPKRSDLIITIQHNNDQPVTLYQATLDDFQRFKEIRIPYLFNNWGTCKIKYKLTTLNLNWVDNWCEATNDYVVETETIITVGET